MKGKVARKFLRCFIAGLACWKADRNLKEGCSLGLFRGQDIDVALCNPRERSIALCRMLACAKRHELHTSFVPKGTAIEEDSPHHGGESRDEGWLLVYLEGEQFGETIFTFCTVNVD